MNYARISLVTPSFNQGRFLGETIESVLAHDYPGLEYFVFDRGSTDDSVEILRRYSDRLTNRESVPDNGQMDGVAKGFCRATGDLMRWLNSDDLLVLGALWHVARLYAEHPEADLFAAAVKNFTDDELGRIGERVLAMNSDVERMFYLSGRLTHRHYPGIFPPKSQCDSSRRFGE
jgi:glycosyltransferase involved in cell wall biosynthesis